MGGKSKAVVGVLICVFWTLASASAGSLEILSQWRWPPRDDDEGEQGPRASPPRLSAERLDVTAAVGDAVTLPCSVTALGDRTVSWIRSKDLTVLAVGRHTVTSDARFSVRHREGGGDWLLRIAEARASDEGVYDCQVNTHPKTSARIRLRIRSRKDEASILDMPVSDTAVSPRRSSSGLRLRLRVLGPRRRRLPSGSSLSLLCRALTPHDDDDDDDASGRRRKTPLLAWLLGGVRLQGDRVSVRESWSGGRVESELRVLGLRASDSGTYTCAVPDEDDEEDDALAVPDSVAVAVFGDASSSSSPSGGGASSSAASGGEAPSSAASAGEASSRSAVISGAIILCLLLLQVALCVFYIRKV